MVKKKDGKSERFNVNKIIRGLQKARVRHIPRSRRSVMKHLKKLDRVAYIRFASVYKAFEEPEDFQKLIKEVRT
jgi:transcriptional repressor NrdR